MKLTSTYYFKFPNNIYKDGLDGFDITLTSTAGSLNTKTGVIIDNEELQLLISEWSKETFKDVKSIYEIGNLQYLPHSPEIATQRLWEWIDDILPFSAKLVGLKVTTISGYFVQYIREEPVLVREPQPQPKPQTKFRKRRKKSGRSKRKDKD